MSYFYPFFKLDNLNGFIAGFIILFSILTVIYSLRFIRKSRPQYYTYIILTTLSSLGAVLANNLVVLLVFWGFLGLILYLLINLGKDAETAAKKTFIIVGGSDCLMLLGILIIHYLTGTFQMDKIKIPLLSTNPLITNQLINLPIIAYLCIALACFAKAGAIPLHTWIPDCVEFAPVPVTAFLPASLDKLLGIYLLARISLNLFNLSTYHFINLFLMLIGAFTIIAAVMMALVQHNMKKLLGYHAVSQVGYMVLGIGVANPIGIAGGIFHMLNNSIYKQALFLISGNVEKNTDTTDLDKLGGLSKAMPITYISAIITSLSISGIPPFNGFVSKWMIYCGLIQSIDNSQYIVYRSLVVLCLICAMFGSALTLASFIKLIHATFLSKKNFEKKISSYYEVSFTMWFPCLVLAILCILFGIFSYQIPLRYFMLPIVIGLKNPFTSSTPVISDLDDIVGFFGTWYVNLSILLLIIGFILGFLIFKLKWSMPNLRQDTNFIGTEPHLEDSKVSGVEFYNTIKELGFFKKIYAKLEEGFFDIYEHGKTVIFGFGKFFQFLHNGVLPTYLVWCLLGMLVLFLVLR